MKSIIMSIKRRYNLIAFGENTYRMIKDNNFPETLLTRICLCDLNALAFWDALISSFHKSNEFVSISKAITLQKFNIDQTTKSNIPIALGNVIPGQENKKWELIDISNLKENRTVDRVINIAENYIEKDVLTILVTELSEMSPNLIEPLKDLLHKHGQHVTLVGIIPFKFKGEEKYKRAITFKTLFANCENLICFDENDCIKGENVVLSEAWDRSSAGLFELLNNKIIYI
jgi:hypothetical protein